MSQCDVGTPIVTCYGPRGMGLDLRLCTVGAHRLQKWDSPQVAAYTILPVGNLKFAIPRTIARCAKGC